VTTRIYYTDAETRSFEAVVQSCDTDGGRHVVQLDRTAFYPTSGGQPFDLGRIGDASVLDVIDQDDGGIAHVVDRPLVVGMAVQAEIDWPRRFDHMQQHTGQHMLSAAFDSLIGAATVSFHMGTDVSTIDLSRETSANEIATIEAEANRIVWEDRSVTIRFVSADEARTLPLRKAPAREGPLRLVDVQDCDLSACGGTHVRSTGVVGIVVVTASERFKGGTRVSFVCGGRALRSHRRLRDVVAGATRLLSAGADGVGAQIERMLQDGRDRARVLADVQAELTRYRAKDWRDAAETIGGHRVVLRADPESDAGALKSLAQAIVTEPGLTVVLVGGGQPAPIVVARSMDVGFDAGAFVRAATAALGGRGGGRPELAQAGLTASADEIVVFVRQQLAS
jgi:alanyl-tRNA synthetase